MNRNLLIGIAGGALAVALAGGAVYAGPAIEHSFSTTAQTTTATTTAQPNPAARAQRGKRNVKAAMLVRVLVKGTADATATPPKEVMAALKQGQSLAQYAQAHGKTTDDVIQLARKNLETRLNTAKTNGKLTQERIDALLKQFDASAPKVMADTNLGQQIGRAAAKRHPGAAGLVKATADVTSTQPKDVMAALKQGQSLAQYAQAHGKTADDILAQLRTQGQQRLDTGLDKAKQLIEQPGLGRANQPSSASPTATPSE